MLWRFSSTNLNGFRVEVGLDPSIARFCSFFLSTTCLMGYFTKGRGGETKDWFLQVSNLWIDNLRKKMKLHIPNVTSKAIDRHWSPVKLEVSFDLNNRMINHLFIRLMRWLLIAIKFASGCKTRGGRAENVTMLLYAWLYFSFAAQVSVMVQRSIIGLT